MSKKPDGRSGSVGMATKLKGKQAVCVIGLWEGPDTQTPTDFNTQTHTSELWEISGRWWDLELPRSQTGRMCLMLKLTGRWDSFPLKHALLRSSLESQGLEAGFNQPTRWTSAGPAISAGCVEVRVRSPAEAVFKSCFNFKTHTHTRALVSADYLSSHQFTLHLSPHNQSASPEESAHVVEEADRQQGWHPDTNFSQACVTMEISRLHQKGVLLQFSHNRHEAACIELVTVLLFHN